MDSKQKKIVIGMFSLVLLAWLGVPFWGGWEEPVRPVTKETLRFNGAEALATAREFVTRYPKRELGSIEARQSTGFLRDYLERYGYTITYSHFDAMIAGHRQVGRNVLGFRRNELPETIAVVAHYDTAVGTNQGASDNGTGVGVMLQLARILAERPVRRSLLFIATDGQESGMLGALDIAEHQPDRGRIAAVLSLDGVSAGELAGFRLDDAGLRRGFTPPWLRQVVQNCAMAQGLPATDVSGFGENLERALLLPRHDQGPFLRAGIAAVNLAGEPADLEFNRRIMHSGLDTIGNIDTVSVEKYGQVAERTVLTLDELPSTPDEPMGTFRWSDEIFVSPFAILVLQFLTFVPLAAMAWFHWSNSRRSLDAKRIGRELAAWLAWLLPFVSIYYVIVLLHRLRVLPLYSLYPGTLKDPLLEHPSWGVLGTLIGVGVVAAVVFQLLLWRLSKRLPHPDLQTSKPVLLTVFTAVVLLALLYNAYWAVAFLALPSLVWGLTGAGGDARRRTANLLMIAASGIVFYLVMAASAADLGLGWKLIWFDILSLGTGLLPWQGFFLAAAAIALAFRFMALQFEPASPAESEPSEILLEPGRAGR